MSSITVIGDVMMDILARISSPIAHGSDAPASISHAMGGSACNTALWLAVQGEKVRLISAVGHDDSAQLIRQRCDSFGVDPQFEVFPSVATGTCIVIIDETGERTMLPDSGANIFLSQGWCVNKIEGDHLHVSAYPLFQPSTAPVVIAALAQARTTGMSISLDLASSAPLESHRGIVREACTYADVVFTNEEEARALLASPSHESRQELHNRMSQLARIAVVKQGPQGAVAISGDLCIAAPAPQVHVVDTTGAGDALAAGFLATWLQNGDLNAAIESGVRVATEVVGRVGAGPYADVTRD